MGAVEPVSPDPWQRESSRGEVLSPGQRRTERDRLFRQQRTAGQLPPVRRGGGIPPTQQQTRTTNALKTKHRQTSPVSLICPPRAVHAQRHRRSGTHRTKRGPAGRATTRRPRCRIRRQPRPRPLRCRNRSLCQALRRLGWARHPSLCDAHRRRVVFLTRRGACGHAPLLVEYAVSVQGVPYLTGRGGQAAGGTTEPPRIHPPDR